MERKITKIPSIIDLQTHIQIDSKAKRNSRILMKHRLSIILLTSKDVRTGNL